MRSFTQRLLVPFGVIFTFTSNDRFTCHCWSNSNHFSSRVLTASDEGVLQFDTGCVANPVILPPSSDNEEEWQCYYYGNNGSWNGGRKCFLPTGSSGLAVSKDGLAWTKVAGSEQGGAMLTPSEKSWDSVHTGVGDVVRIDHSELHMYYFGADDEEIAMGPGGTVVGLRMRIGRAKSLDNGKTWNKDNTFLLDYDETEGLFASWPRIVTFEGTNRPWRMYYHAFDGNKWRVFGAESRDKGDTWSRTGLVVLGETDNDSNDDDAFDYRGIGTRTVTHWRDGLLMIYEGVDKTGKHSLGAAYCEIQDTGKDRWRKLNEGKPILEPGKEPLENWTKHVIGTPFLVTLPDSSLRLYYCAKDSAESKMSIGVVESKSGDVESDCWKISR